MNNHSADKKRNHNRCKYCGMSTGLFFCPKCGRVLTLPSLFEDKIQESVFQSYISSFVKDASSRGINISAYTDIEVLSNLVAIRYNESILYLQKNNERLSSIGEQTLTELMRDFADKCKNKACHIAVVGRIGSGKSTFINALLGKEVYYTTPFSETSVLTNVKYSKGKDYIRVSFYNTSEWDRLWQSAIKANQESIIDNGFLSEYNRLRADDLCNQLLNKEEESFFASDVVELRGALDRYLSCESPYHFFVKEVEIGLSSFVLPKSVVLVDTLGLDDPVHYRTGISERIISSADIIILCINASDAWLSTYELDVIARVFSIAKTKENVYFVGTQYDIPGDFSNYWREKTRPEFNRHLSTMFNWKEEELSEKRLFPVSAWYNIIIQRAKCDSEFDQRESDVDCLAEVLCRCLGRSTAYQYGTDYSALRKCMIEHLLELESMTNVSNVIDCITDGPISDFERQSIDDFNRVYLSIIKQLNNNTWLEYKSSSLIINQLSALDSKISHYHKEGAAKNKAIKSILMSL